MHIDIYIYICMYICMYAYPLGCFLLQVCEWFYGASSQMTKLISCCALCGASDYDELLIIFEGNRVS